MLPQLTPGLPGFPHNPKRSATAERNANARAIRSETVAMSKNLLFIGFCSKSGGLPTSFSLRWFFSHTQRDLAIHVSLLRTCICLSSLSQQKYTSHFRRPELARINQVCNFDQLRPVRFHDKEGIPHALIGRAFTLGRDGDQSPIAFEHAPRTFQGFPTHG